MSIDNVNNDTNRRLPNVPLPMQGGQTSGTSGASVFNGKRKEIEREVDGVKQSVFVYHDANGQKHYTDKDGNELEVKNSGWGKKTFVRSEQDAVASTRQESDKEGRTIRRKVDGVYEDVTIMHDVNGNKYHVDSKGNILVTDSKFGKNTYSRVKVQAPPTPPTPPTPPATDPTPPVTDPTPPVTDPTPPVTDPTPPVTDPTPPVTDPTPPVTDPTPPATDPNDSGTDPNDSVTDPNDSGTDPNADAAKRNTTLGGLLTLAAKGYAKRKQIKAIRPTVAEQTRRARAKGKALKVKLQPRYIKAQKIRDARNAIHAANDADKKLKKLRNKLKYQRELLNKTKKGLKNLNVNKINKRIAELNKQIKAQETIVNNTRRAASEATRVARRAVERRVVRKTAVKAAEGAAKVAGKTAVKTAAKTTGKALGKTVLKKIPVVGLVLGCIFAADRIMHGDYIGAGMEVASGAASCIPGVGTAVSVAIDVGIAAKDLHDENII